VASLAYVCFIAGFTLQFVYAAFVVVGCHSMVFGSGLLLYRVRAFERYLYVCLFKEVCDLSDFGTMKCEDGPFLVFVMCFVHVGFVLSISLLFCYVMHLPNHNTIIKTLTYNSVLCL
jgi:hypothetical protein